MCVCVCTLKNGSERAQIIVISRQWKYSLEKKFSLHLQKEGFQASGLFMRKKKGKSKNLVQPTKYLDSYS